MVIVIGASGFIGSYLVRQLVGEGYEVLATGRRKSALKYYVDHNIPNVEVDISECSDFEKLPQKGVEAVIILAALLPANSVDNDPYEYVDVNIKGTLNVLEYCRKNGIKKVISTTSYADIQEKWEKNVPLADDIERNFKLAGDHASYIISKNAATDFILHYNADYSMQGIIFRLPPVYGVGPHSVIYVDGKIYKSGLQIFIDKAVAGENIQIYGDKDVSRDVVSVKDVVSAFILAIKSNAACGIYNISSGRATTLEEQVEAIIDIFSTLPNKSRIEYLPEKPNNSKSFLLDISKAEKDFGYNPSFADFHDLMEDYKQDLDNDVLSTFFGDRKK